jgi:outer membrane protein, heavy metal efflux system
MAAQAQAPDFAQRSLRNADAPQLQKNRGFQSAQRMMEMAPTQEMLTLKQAERLFAERSRELLLAQMAVQAAEADSISAAAQPNPNLFMSATQIGNLYPPGYDYSRLDRRADIIVGLNRTFERGGKRELRMAVAESNKRASRHDLSDVQRAQMVVLHSAYYDLVLAQEKVRIAGLTSASFRRTIDAAAMRLKAGDIAPSDLARIQVDALRAENDARTARAEREKAQTALAYLTGLEARARAIEAADGQLAIENIAFGLDLEETLNNRPDVTAAQARVRAAEEKRNLALASRTRDITGSVQFEHVAWNPLANPTAVNTVGFGVSIPLFTNYYFEGEIRRAEVELDAARANLEKVKALALGDIESSRADLESAIDRVRRFDGELLKEAQKAADAAEFAYSNGAIGVMDLLDSRRQLYLTRLEASAAHADYAKSIAAWRAAIEAPTAALP